MITDQQIDDLALAAGLGEFTYTDDPAGYRALIRTLVVEQVTAACDVQERGIGHTANAFSIPENMHGPDPEKNWQEFWVPTLEIGLHTSLEAIVELCKLELSDYLTMMMWSEEVYDHVTGGGISKWNTWPSVVCSVHDDHVSELVEEAMKEHDDVARLDWLITKVNCDEIEELEQLPFGLPIEKHLEAFRNAIDSAREAEKS